MAAPDHTGNTVFDRLSGGGDPFEQIAFDRPNDVARVITAFTDAADPAVGAFAADDRVDAIIPLAPASSEVLLADELIAALDVPMMVVVGTDDVTTPVDPNVTRLWDLTSITPAYRVELVAGEHQTFTDLCAYSEFLPTLPDVPEFVITTIEEYGTEGCSDGDIDARRAADITNTYVIRFLDEVFRGGPSIDEAIVEAPADALFDRR